MPPVRARRSSFLLSFTLIGASGLAACIPPPGFARTPTPVPPTISAAFICDDYVKDLLRAFTDIRRDLQDQIADLTAVVVSGQSPADAVARRISQRRDDLTLAVSHFALPSPCPEGQRGRDRLARTSPFIKEATNLLNIASDDDDPVYYTQATDAYRRALTALTETSSGS